MLLLSGGLVGQPRYRPLSLVTVEVAIISLRSTRTVAPANCSGRNAVPLSGCSPPAKGRGDLIFLARETHANGLKRSVAARAVMRLHDTGAPRLLAPLLQGNFGSNIGSVATGGAGLCCGGTLAGQGGAIFGDGAACDTHALGGQLRGQPGVAATLGPGGLQQLGKPQADLCGSGAAWPDRIRDQGA